MAVGFNMRPGAQADGQLLPQLLAACSAACRTHPNGGAARPRDGQTVFDVGADDFADMMRDLVPLGYICRRWLLRHNACPYQSADRKMAAGCSPAASVTVS